MSVAVASSPVSSPVSPFRSHRHRRSLWPAVSPPSSPLRVSCVSPKASVAAAAAVKRKRPGRIEIPPVELSAVFEEEGKRVVEEEEAGRWSVYSKRGRKRLQIEDRFTALVDIHGNPNLAFFGVFDGHGGKLAAEFASENMGRLILEEFMKTGDGLGEAVEAVRIGYSKTDAEFLKTGMEGGSCCLTALVRNGDVIVSNAGDCRAVLCRSGKAEALTSDHRPSREDEKDRIECHGGFVDFCRGTWRLQGSLAVSRGIGDSHLKQWVIPDPETKVVNIQDDCEFLILASDGLWDKVGNQEAVDIARSMCVDPDNLSTLSACKKLAELSVTRGSADDISVMIIPLQQFLHGGEGYKHYDN